MTVGIGKPTCSCTVLYIAAEGVSGLAKRIDAWLTSKGIEECQNLFIYPNLVDFGDDDMVEDLKRNIQSLHEKPRLIVIDTLARCMNGADENSAKDMGSFISGVDTIKKAFNCAILLLHHTNKANGRNERGSSSLRGAADTMLSLDGENGKLSLACAKQKDFEPFKDLSLELKKIGETDSCVLQRTKPVVDTYGQTLFELEGSPPFQLIKLFPKNKSAIATSKLLEKFKETKKM